MYTQIPDLVIGIFYGLPPGPGVGQLGGRSGVQGRIAGRDLCVLLDSCN